MPNYVTSATSPYPSWWIYSTFPWTSSLRVVHKRNDWQSHKNENIMKQAEDHGDVRETKIYFSIYNIADWFHHLDPMKVSKNSTLAFFQSRTKITYFDWRNGEQDSFCHHREGNLWKSLLQSSYTTLRNWILGSTRDSKASRKGWESMLSLDNRWQTAKNVKYYKKKKMEKKITVVKCYLLYICIYLLTLGSFIHI